MQASTPKPPLIKIKKHGVSARFFLLVLMCLSYILTHAATKTSTATGGNWATGSSWVGGTAPATTDIVVIATTGAGKITVAAAAVCAGVTINSGATLVSTTLGLTVNGPWMNNGTYTQGTATVTFGGAAAAINNGTGTANFNNIVIASGATLTINDAVTVAGSFRFTTVSANTDATISSNNSLTVTGAMTMARPAAGFNCTFDVGAGTLSVGSLTMSATVIGSGARRDIITLSTGTCTVTGTVTLSGTTGCEITFTGAGILNLGNTVSAGPPTLTPATGTVNYTRAGVQTPWATTYNNLTLGGSGAKTIGAITVNGILSMEGTATASAAPTYGVNATLQYNTTSAEITGAEWPATFTAGSLTGGVIIQNTGDITLNGAKTLELGMPLTINSGATLNMSTFLLTLNDNFINNSGTLTGTTGGVTITGNAAQSIGAFSTTGMVSSTKSGNTATFTGDISGGGLTINNTGGSILNLGTTLNHTFGTFVRTAGTLQGNTSTLNISGAITNTAGTFIANTGTVNFTGASGQTIPPLTYYDLGFSGAGTKTIATATTITVGNNWNTGSATTMAGTAGADITGDITGSGIITMNTGTITLGGNWTNNGAFVSGSGTVIYDGTTQSVAGLTYNNLQLSSAGVKTLAGNTGVNAVLTINSPAELNLDVTTLTLSGAGTPLVNNGVFTASLSTVVYSSVSTANITALDYHNLDGTGGSRTLSNADTIRIAGLFTPGAGAYTVTGSIVEFNGTGNQNIPSFTFDKLIVSNAGIKKILATIVVACQTIDINGNASVEIDADGNGKLNVLE
jgi:hypothetical protein